MDIMLKVDIIKRLRDEGGKYILSILVPTILPSIKPKDMIYRDRATEEGME
jgi:hypothetical protein